MFTCDCIIFIIIAFLFCMRTNFSQNFLTNLYIPKLSHVTIFHEVFNKRNVKRRSQKTVLWLCPTKHHTFNIMVIHKSFNVHCCKSGVFFQGYTGITQDLMSFQYNYKVFYSVIRKITSQITSFWCKLHRFLQLRVRP